MAPVWWVGLTLTGSNLPPTFYILYYYGHIPTAHMYVQSHFLTCSKALQHFKSAVPLQCSLSLCHWCLNIPTSPAPAKPALTLLGSHDTHVGCSAVLLAGLLARGELWARAPMSQRPWDVPPLPWFSFVFYSENSQGQGIPSELDTCLLICRSESISLNRFGYEMKLWWDLSISKALRKNTYHYALTLSTHTP